MVRFQYQVDQDSVELQASNWFGMERLIVNGEQVTQKININNTSSHQFKLSNGKNCRFQMFVDPITEGLVCRIYKNEQLVTSLKQTKTSLKSSQKKLQLGLLLTGFISILFFLILQ
ncbi:hypothetical protein [Parashewanella tropica]|uniref:hypothetical protein n=1 Tax=Parashewanella tropica TaxID=2547970 RepID=UPI0010599E96|nr:hypothetical protein [Parashewanella tropica]